MSQIGRQRGPSATGQRPLFSVLLPVWNRRAVIGRCLDSILSQSFAGGFEVIAVDDGSTDGSAEAMSDCRDGRLAVIRHGENRGVCAARATAAAAARGEWHLMVDSDWQLAPGALEHLAELARQAPPDVGWIGACVRSDRGQVWPTAPLPQGPFGFQDYLGWLDRVEDSPSDFLSCRRAEVHREVAWPLDRRLEFQMNLRIAHRWRLWVLRQVCAVVHTDCANRYMTDVSAEGIARRLAAAPAQADSYREILAEFGPLLRRHAPRRYWRTLTAAARFHLMAGRRARGLCYGLAALLRRPWAIRTAVSFALGLVSPRSLARAYGRRLRRRNRPAGDPQDR